MSNVGNRVARLEERRAGPRRPRPPDKTLPYTGMAKVAAQLGAFTGERWAMVGALEPSYEGYQSLWGWLRCLAEREGFIDAEGTYTGPPSDAYIDPIDEDAGMTMERYESHPARLWSPEIQERLDAMSAALDHPRGVFAFYEEQEAGRKAAERERFKDVVLISEEAEAEREREEQRRAKRREQAVVRKAQALLRSRLLLSEHTTGPSVWPKLLTVRRQHGKQGAIGFLLGVGVCPEVIATIVHGLPSGRR